MCVPTCMFFLFPVPPLVLKSQNVACHRRLCGSLVLEEEGRLGFKDQYFSGKGYLFQSLEVRMIPILFSLKLAKKVKSKLFGVQAGRGPQEVAAAVAAAGQRQEL